MQGLDGRLKARIALLRLKTGDSEAFGFFYDLYARDIYRFAYFRTASKEIAEDIAHEVFLHAWQYIVDKKEVRNLRAFLFRVARNKVADYFRASVRQEQLLDLLPDGQSSAAFGDIDQQSDLQVIRQKLSTLKEEYREIIVLRYFDGLSIEEIAEIIEKDKNNVRVTLHRALTKLKDLLRHNSNEES